jgi:hypothetical protein
MLTRAELKLAADLLKVAGEVFCRHGCNDYFFPKDVSQGEIDSVMHNAFVWNGSPEDFKAGQKETNDWFLMAYLAHRLEEAANETGAPVEPDSGVQVQKQSGGCCHGGIEAAHAAIDYPGDLEHLLKIEVPEGIIHLHICRYCSCVFSVVSPP